DQRWLEGGTLKMGFPRIYDLELCKDITVASKISHPSLDSSADRWTWKMSGSRDFSVASVRQLIDDKILPEAHKTRWVRYVPIKVNVIAWKVKCDSLPTRFNI
ncbi:hypothetical protein Tco_0035502, partial [Tanacetum coccineum]